MRFAWQHQQDPATRYDRKIDDEDEEEYDDENETLNIYETLG